MYEIFYSEIVVETDIPKIGTREQRRIRKAIEEKLTTHPELYGIPLRQSLRGYRKLRVGDYRVVFRIVKKRVIVLAIGHRSSIYDRADKRK